MKAIEKKENSIRDLSFVDNEITQEGADFLFNWLKNIRMRDVGHNLNITNCDLSLNKVLHRQLEKIEAELLINRKFVQDVRNIEIKREKRKMKISATELRRN